MSKYWWLMTCMFIMGIVAFIFAYCGSSALTFPLGLAGYMTYLAIQEAKKEQKEKDKD